MNNELNGANIRLLVQEMAQASLVLCLIFHPELSKGISNVYQRMMNDEILI